MVSSTIVNPSNMFRHRYNIVMGRAIARSSQLVRPDFNPEHYVIKCVGGDIFANTHMAD